LILFSILSTLTDAITTAIGNYGLYAVFLLMLADAVLPAASEVVMVYGGAIASGAIAGASVNLFGYTFEPGFPAYWETFHRAFRYADTHLFPASEGHMAPSRCTLGAS
jgi:predicted metal-binding membrane protein